MSTTAEQGKNVTREHHVVTQRN